jgi:hypothetical protein
MPLQEGNQLVQQPLPLTLLLLQSLDAPQRLPLEPPNFQVTLERLLGRPHLELGGPEVTLQPLGPGFGPNITIEEEVDAGIVRYTEEVAEFVRRLADAEEDRPANVPEGVEWLERELGRASGACPPGQPLRASSHGPRTSIRTGSSRRTSLRFSSSGAMSS